MEEQTAPGEESTSRRVRPVKRRRKAPAALVVACLIGLVLWIGYLFAPAFDRNRLGLDGTPESAQWSPMALVEMYALIDVDEILSGGPPKDGIPALTDSPVVDGDAAPDMRPGERVIGVEIGGEARAYPLRILVWHENANDTLGDRPISVSYCPLCDSALVIDRDIGGRVREFGISGKLYRSNVLMYDRRFLNKDESLWSQLMLKAVVGPAAEQGLEMKLIPSVLTTWEDWLSRYPDTTVLSMNTGHDRDYGRSPYAFYFADDEVMIATQASSDRRPDLRNKDEVVVATVNGKQRIYVVKDVAEAAGPNGSIEDELGGVRLRVTHLEAARSLRIQTAGDDENKAGPEVLTAHTFWFGWEEINPGVEIWSPEP